MVRILDGTLLGDLGGIKKKAGRNFKKLGNNWVDEKDLGKSKKKHGREKLGGRSLQGFRNILRELWEEN